MIVKPVIKVTKVAAPYIGAAVGGTTGFIAGGPAGAWAGAKLGAKIGSVAQAAFKSCIPHDSLRLRCDGQLVLQNGIKLVAGSIVGSIAGQYAEGMLSKWIKI